MNDRRSDGQAAEQAALAHLQAAGLTLLAANVGYRGGELDLVMRDKRGVTATIVFVEVRHRRNLRFGGGAASIDAGKRRRVVLAAQLFLSRQPRLRDLPCRFDVVETTGDAAAPTLRWIEDAFRADD
ncbi:YraN family protein [Luteimonas sp. S4-F44]|uniref:YraN family protein n=1 Tax=Luteimonas sp. S4-F44 TaxID=2925842 RepID=UPI001F52E628|nr:YraN family protein [Luteimonas sp. S4-F44]UNK43061.1 YraN family protein [Luteimonas sp. S4-F44]